MTKFAVYGPGNVEPLLLTDDFAEAGDFALRLPAAEIRDAETGRVLMARGEPDRLN